MTVAAPGGLPAAGQAAGGDALSAWAERSGHRRVAEHDCAGLRFAFYGRVSTEDWQDPVTSRARQREQAEMLVRGHGQVVAEFFDAGESRTVAWGRRPQAAALVAQLADPGRSWDAIVIGEYERAFYGSQYASMAPLLEHYGVQLWMPETCGRVDYASEHDEHAMTVLGLSSKREVTRTSIRVRTAMAVQARERGRYLGGRPPCGYRLGDAGPHPNKAHAAWGRRAHRLEPDPETAHVVRWMFAQRLAGHSVARIARALNEAGAACPSAADPGRNPHRTGAGWTLGTVTTILSNPYLLAGLLACGTCGRRMESAWSNGKPAYRCRHGHTTASTPDLSRPKNAHIREDRILAHLPALHVLLTGTSPAGGRRRRTRRGADVRQQASPADVTGYLREQQITLTYDPAAGTLRAGTGEAAQTITLTAS
jgi:DNA invertase Pin-like site-specific DNA recombinase